jgi:predicted esterase
VAIELKGNKQMMAFVPARAKILLCAVVLAAVLLGEQTLAQNAKDAKKTSETEGEKPKLEFKPGEEVRVDLPKAGSYMMVYVPKDYSPDRSWPMIFCYHGYKGKASTYPFRQITQGAGFIVLGMNYATKDYGETLCRASSGTKPEKAYLAEALALVKESLNIDPHMAFMGGFSQGGYSTSFLGEQLLDRLAGLVILGAGRNQADTNPPPAKLIRGKPIFIGAGVDDKRHCAAARNAAKFYRRRGAKVTLEEWLDVGHSVETKNTKLHDWLLHNGPLKKVRSMSASAQKAEKLGWLGLAYVAYKNVASLSTTDKTCLAAATAADRLAEKAEELFAEAQQAVDNKNYLTAHTALAQITTAFKDSDFEKRASPQLKALATDPKIQAIIDQAKIDAKADALEAKAVAAENEKLYLKAFKFYERYLAKFPKATRYEKVKAHLAALKEDKAVKAAINTGSEAEEECTGWLSLADAYIQSGMPDKARPHLQKIIDKYGDSPWAKQAREQLAKIDRRR